MISILSLLLIMSVFPVSFPGVSAKKEYVMPFIDVPEDSWYYEAAAFMNRNGFMNGTSQDRFSPGISISRGMLICMIGVINGVEKGEYMYSYFNDCSVNDYYTPYVSWAYENKIASGTGDKLFSPNDHVTREQMAVFIVQMMELNGLDITISGDIPERYEDADTISDWAYDAVRCCIFNGIISGMSDSEISPKSSCTRAQAAVIFHKLLGDLFVNSYSEHFDFMIANDLYKTKPTTIAQFVTRSFFAESIVYYTGFSDSLRYYVYETDESLRRFSDLDGGSKRANAEIAVSQGYMVCDGDKFRPDDNITYGEVMRGLIWALGYREYADRFDTLEFASELGLDKYIVQDKDENAPVTFGELSSILRVGLFTNTVICVKDESGEYTVTSRGVNSYLYRLYIMNYRTSDILHLANGGWDIFGGGGWRYGPSMIINGDGSIDMWLAGNAAVYGEVDWGYHQTSYDGGFSFTREKPSVCPTYASEDWNWCCDPSVFRLGDYYYAGYTSICWRQGYDNNLYIARSKDPNDFTSEKWNGSSWGGTNPLPAIVYDGVYHTWGCGEPSFVVKDNTIYCYVTWTSNVSMRKVYTAPADDPDWPGKLKLAGVSIYVQDPNEDSIDVKYADAYGQFIAVCTGNRMMDNSNIIVYTSFDGITFRRENVIVGEGDNLVVDGIHNIGISGDERGHIDIYSQNYVCFAYTGKTDKWGNWHTRFVPITLFGGLNYGSEENVISRDDPSEIVTAITDPDAPVRLFTSKTAYTFDRTGSYSEIWLYYETQSGEMVYIDDFNDPDLSFVYDGSILNLDKKDRSIALRKMKGTNLVIKYKDALTTLRISVTNHKNYKPVSIHPENETVLFTYRNEKKQNGLVVSNGIGDYLMVWGKDLSSYNVYSNGLDSSLGMWKQSVFYSGYDQRVVAIDEKGVITAMSPGRTTVVCNYDGFITSFEIIVPEEIFVD
ncbi:MAG: S-layer homology domain-containing protein [Clostridia bacterium]|nr:S-layer homology domain-containing protein [Clostridia bacterium]